VASSSTLEPASAEENAGHRGVDEQFLDAGSCPGWATCESLARYEETLGARLLAGSPATAGEPRAKGIWGPQLLPGCH